MNFKQIFFFLLNRNLFFFFLLLLWTELAERKSLRIPRLMGIYSTHNKKKWTEFITCNNAFRLISNNNNLRALAMREGSMDIRKIQHAIPFNTHFHRTQWFEKLKMRRKKKKQKKIYKFISFHSQKLNWDHFEIRRGRWRGKKEQTSNNNDNNKNI